MRGPKEAPGGPLAVALSERVYSLLLALAYPRDFRAECGREMREMFRDACMARWKRAGWTGVTTHWGATLKDVMRNGAAERRERHGAAFLRPWDGVGTDIGIAVRGLRQSPSFTVIALLTLALGIGATTAVFSVVDSALLSGLPYPDSDRLVLVSRYDGDASPTSDFSYLDAMDIVADARSFAALAPFNREGIVVGKDTQGRRVSATKTTAKFFDALEIPPLMGRVIRPEDEPSGAERVVVLSHELWASVFDADPEILGTTIRVDNLQHTVVGVMPPEFGFPRGAQLWLPLHPNPLRGMHWLDMVGRLAPGVAADDAQMEVSAIVGRLGEEFPGRYKDNSAGVVALHEAFTSNARPTLTALIIAVGAVLLIGCANIANLLLARATVRRRELAVRAAIGASRLRLVRQMLTESLVLAVSGGLLGVVVAYQGTALLGAMVPPGAAPIEAGVSLRLLGFSATLVLLTGLVFGLAPALRGARVDLNATLTDQWRGKSGGARTRGRRSLVVAEVALAVALLVCAGLTIRTMRVLIAADIGLDPTDTWTLNLELPLDLAAEDFNPEEFVSRFFDFNREVRQQVEALPGVEAAAFAAYVPFSGYGWGSYVMVQGRPVLPRPERYMASGNYVTPGYFETFGIPLIRGRLFDDGDTWETERVAVVNETLARALWPDGDHMGARITNAEVEDERWYTVVGVVEDHRTAGLLDEPSGQFFIASAQNPYPYMNLVVRTPDLGAVGDRIREVVRTLEPELTAAEFQPIESYIEGRRTPTRYLMTLLTAFAGLALLLAAIGTYGVISYGVNQRAHELGVRRALGARTADILRLVASGGMRLALIGTAIGLAAGWGVGRLMTGLLFDVSPADPLTLGLVGMLAIGVALAACLIPARRAARIDPLATLRGA